VRVRPLHAVVCGHVTLDRVASGLVPGGSAYYAGHAWRALGARTSVLTAAADDLPAAALAGLEAVRSPASRTTVFVNAHAASGARRQRVEASAPPLDPARLPADWRAPDVLHLAPVLAETDLAAFRGATRARLVGLGAQGLVRRVGPGGAVEQPPWDFDPADLGFVHAAFVGEDDLRGQGDLVARLAAAVPVVVLTLGARGCEVVVTGRRTRRVGVFPAEEIDPTGAGDVFAAAFLHALARGLEPVEAARLGAAAASIAIEGEGGAALGRVGEAFARSARVPVLG
jgi:1D-myo-inositol 3-kinase